jgi:hypothetical protein
MAERKSFMTFDKHSWSHATDDGEGWAVARPDEIAARARTSRTTSDETAVGFESFIGP